MTEQNPAAEEQQTEHRRTIKSFVMRAGRMTEGQQRGWSRELARSTAWSLPMACAISMRCSAAARGPSRSASAWATRRWKWPPRRQTGFHRRGVHKPGVGALLSGLVSQKLTNVRVYSCDATEVLRDCVADASTDRVLLFFGPTAQSRHHKRRIVQPAFAELVRRQAEGRRRAAHGHRLGTYAEHMPMATWLQADAACHARRSAGEVRTPRERLGHGVWDLKFQRID